MHCSAKAELRTYLLNLQFFRRRCNDVLDDVVEALQVHLEEVLQRERLRVHVELDVRLFHQRAPVAFAQRFVLQIQHERQRLPELLHAGLDELRQRHAFHLARHLLQLADEVLDAVDEQLHVEVAPQRLGPHLPRLDLRLVQLVELLEVAHFLLHDVQLRVRRDGQVEELLGVGQLLLFRFELGQLVAVDLDELEALRQLVGRLDRARTVLGELVGERRDGLAQTIELNERDLGETTLDALQIDIAMLGVQGDRVPTAVQ